MAQQSLFESAFIYLAAAVVCVPLAKRFGLSAVLGYLVAGMVIGPFGFGLIGEHGEAHHIVDCVHSALRANLGFHVSCEHAPAITFESTAPFSGRAPDDLYKADMKTFPLKCTREMVWMIRFARP